MWAGAGAILLLLAGVAPAVAAASPELLNKTIQVRFTTTTPVHRDNGDNLMAVSNKLTTIYVSSAGRAFSRAVDMDGSPQNRRTRERGPGENTVQLQGRKLVQNRKMTSGVIHMEVDVDASGSSCAATLVVGRESGSALRWKGVSGMMATATGPMTISNVACSISAGNGVAQ